MATEGWNLATEGCIPEARERVARAIELYSDHRLKNLMGWLYFLDGDIDSAEQHWQEIPPDAVHVCRVYNAALAEARAGHSEASLHLLAELCLPFRPALALRVACAKLMGDPDLVKQHTHAFYAAFPPNRSPDPSVAATIPPATGSSTAWNRRGWGRIAAAICILLLGIGVGYSTRPATTLPSERIAPNGQVSVDESTAEIATTPGPDSLQIGWAFLTDNAHTIAAAMGAEEIEVEPSQRLAAIPASTRLQVGRSWYLDGLDAFQSGDQNESVPLFTAAIASVGAGSSVYWVDDGLYMLIGALAEARPSAAKRLARILRDNHPASMYNNSTLRDILLQEPTD